MTVNFSSLSHGMNSEVYHLRLLSLYNDFVSLVFDICTLFITNPIELAYITAAQWPGFVQPILVSHPSGDLHLRDDLRIRLLRAVGPKLSDAVESLYPRRIDAKSWAGLHASQDSLSSITPLTGAVHPAYDAHIQDLRYLPRMSQFILLASYLASSSPAKTDARMFSRGLDVLNHKKRRGAGMRKPKIGGSGSVAKVPQRLLGPAPFNLDRMIAILGVLLEEYDTDENSGLQNWLGNAFQYSEPGEFTDMEINRVQVYTAVSPNTQANSNERYIIESGF